MLGTLGAIAPYHDGLVDVCKEHDGLHVVCDADDGYFSGAPEVLYRGYEYQCELVRDRVGLESNATKVKAVAPRGGVEGIPAGILDAPRCSA